MELRLQGIVVIVGNYGSGKSEVAVNLAVHHRHAGHAGGDRRSRSGFGSYSVRVRPPPSLRELGIDVVLPPPPYRQSELPVLSPAVAGLIRRPGELSILDVGGDNVGAMVLAALGESLCRDETARFCRSSTPCDRLPPRRRVAKRSARRSRRRRQLTVTGWAGNANLIDETTPPEIVDGYAFMKTAVG